ncbi:hypothetical protein V8G54_029675 [Vigna mungo]|uniref:Uncharacterized protein n=1 Tax=Vigna mungo TaxID=3915 RepID=A0AAQ3MTU8_VIGMU
MEVGEMDGKEPQVEVPLVPATLIKPVPLKPVPIYTPGVINQMGYHANGAVACVEFSIGQEKLCRSDIGSDVARDSGKTGEHTKHTLLAVATEFHRIPHLHLTMRTKKADK